MKKFIYICLFTIVSAATFSACSEEEIKPQTTTESTGAGSVDKKW